jgi:hypothetical protein
MAWWSSYFGGSKEDEKEVSSISESAREEVAGLNFKTAIEAHIKWKLRLKGLVDGTSTEILDPRDVSSDTQCTLGKWIESEGQKRFSLLPEFQKVVTAHTYFHTCAGRTLALVMDGNVEAADAELTSGDFARSSQDISRHLLRLWRDVGIDK